MYIHNGRFGKRSDLKSVAACQVEFEPTQRLPFYFLESETLTSLLSTGWFQERIRAWFT